jgi:hypothetical protein
MATRKIETTDKYADYRYEIVTPEELREAKWLIKEGDFKDMDDYINCITRAEIRRMKREDAEKKKRADIRKKRRLETMKKNKAA